MKKRWMILTALVAVPVALALWRSDTVQDSLTDMASKSDKVVQQTDYPEEVFWGDTHLHTSNSPDAFGWGVRLNPEDALRFARGEEIVSTTGITSQLERPLDFLVIADHSDGLGFSRLIHDTPRFLLPNETLKRWHDLMREGPEGSQQATAEMIDLADDMDAAAHLIDQDKQDKRSLSIWKSSIRTVEKYNDPGEFTAFMGYEFTTQPDGNNLHRVVMMKDGYEKGKQLLPFAAQIDDRPEALWDWMDHYKETTGGDILAIPHNSNVSNGLMFELTAPEGGPMSADYARRRAANEPVVEITQIKGDSESHPYLSPEDELSGFGTTGWELGNIIMSGAKTDDMFAGEYVREALKRGLALDAQTGVNPYKFGVIGSTDTHTGLATGDEDNFFGKHTGNEPEEGKDRASIQMNLGTRPGRFNWQYLAGGYAAAWARSNTRADIFDAFMRREVYGTTGPRMTVRFFGGWDFDATVMNGDWVKAGYENGVPMGGTIENARGKAPSFIVATLKDPKGANLDRVQIVKGWHNADGTLSEKVYDVAWSDQNTRQPVDGKLPAVGNTVDLTTATYENSIGSEQLMSVWQDPDFDPALKAFYYVRAVEIPTPRWVAYDAVRLGETVSEEMEPIAQERAYSSPIWYDPAP